MIKNKPQIGDTWRGSEGGRHVLAWFGDQRWWTRDRGFCVTKFEHMKPLDEHEWRAWQARTGATLERRQPPRNETEAAER
jgi:hypothetical protein